MKGRGFFTAKGGFFFTDLAQKRNLQKYTERNSSQKQKEQKSIATKTIQNSQ